MHKSLPATVLLCAIAPVHAQRSLESYGNPSATTPGAMPFLWANETPRPGAVGFHLTIDGARAGANAVPFLSARDARIDVGSLRVLVDPASAILLPPARIDGRGRARVTLPLPRHRSIVGVRLFAQALALESTPNLRVAATAGLRIRPKENAILVATRIDPPRKGDRQKAIDLASGRVFDFGAQRVDDGFGLAFSLDQTHAFVAGTASRSIGIYDVRTLPPKHVQTRTLTSRFPTWTTVSPDGKRLYVTAPPEIIVLHADPRSPGFGTPFPGGNVPLGRVRDPERLVFAPDGNTAYLANRSSQTGEIVRIDTKIGSRTYHAITGSIRLAGTLEGVAISPDGRWLYAAIDKSSRYEIAVIDRLTLQRLDVDPVAPGVQNIGGEIGIPRTPTAGSASNLIVSPCGRYVYVAEFNHVARVDVRIAARSFRQFDRFTDGCSCFFVIGLALSDAGDRLYASVHGETRLLEYDTATRKLLRTFPVENEVVHLVVR